MSSQKGGAIRIHECLTSLPGFVYTPIALNGTQFRDNASIDVGEFSFAGYEELVNNRRKCFCGRKAKLISVSTGQMLSPSAPPFIFYWGCDDEEDGCSFCVPCNSKGMLFLLKDLRSDSNEESCRMKTSKKYEPFHFALCHEHHRPAINCRKVLKNLPPSSYELALTTKISEKELIIDLPKQYRLPISCYVCPYAFTSNCQHFYIVLRRIGMRDNAAMTTYVLDQHSYSSFFDEPEAASAS